MYIVDEENSVKHSANGEQEVKIKKKGKKKKTYCVHIITNTRISWSN